jgi:large subunit ribosomal protein L19
MDPRIRLVESIINKKNRSSIPNFKSGDTLNVYLKIKDANKERIQLFQGVVIQRKNTSTNGETFTIRKLVGAIGVEKIFPIFSPLIDKIEVVRRGLVRRARLYYLLDKQGKQAKVKERRT